MTGLRLWHYTCRDRAVSIHRSGVLKPHLNPHLGVRVVWLTDMDIPVREALGLTSRILRCDRTEHRFEADPQGVAWWPLWRRNYIRDCDRKDLARGAVEHLEAAHGAMPAHWWVAEVPVPVIYAEAVTE